MNTKIFFAFLMGVIAVGFGHEVRADISGVTVTEGPSLNQRYFGKVKVNGKTRQVGLLTKAIENEPGSYYGVVSEYLNPLHEKGFVSEFVRPGKKKLFSKESNGYLQSLYHWVTIFKFVQNPKTNTFSVYKVKVVDGAVVANATPEKGILKSNGNGLFSGDRAELTVSILNEEKTFKFTKQRRFPLKSTFENSFSAGPYNPGYKEAGVRILELGSKIDSKTRQSTARFDVADLNGVPMDIRGDYMMNHLGSGLYTFSAPENSASTTTGFNLIGNKIGVFVDVYDAKPVLNTVELVLIDPENPLGSQMYFEEFGNEVVSGEL
jgi:hypothetical protein